MNTTAIIVAGGKGLRMNAPTRKQYLALAGQPIIAHTLRRFDACAAIDRIVLVAPDEDRHFIEAELLPSISLQTPVSVVMGGAERQDSVYNGLLAAEDADIAVIHDGVRPFVTPAQIAETVTTAQTDGACILAIPAVDTLKQTDASGDITGTVDRTHIYLAQTPQTFQYDLIRNAHDKARADGFRCTDDASLLERLKIPVKIADGSRFNIKITTPEDIFLAEAIFKR